ncbi:chromate transporter [Tessaracoccus defluvii]|uniref:Chromate transporter n=1 Tax=Tessaracoccus defluvii TaxID=1285901 RepID=A0A7H0H6R1_9ACTN|nr:chromate transporter [Tessaracoccus defluvii]QNP56227.1 chromate transporter [Tessaracoccus defluvii]
MRHHDSGPRNRAHLGLLARLLKVGMIGFGGGSALIPLLQRELVAEGRLDDESFTHDTVIANVTPGALPVKLGALAGTRLGGPLLAVLGATAVALPGTLGTLGLLTLFSRLGPGAVAVIEFASIGISAYIIYLLLEYMHSVLAPGGSPAWPLIAIAAMSFLASGGRHTLALVASTTGVPVAAQLPQLTALQLILVALTVIVVWSFFTARRRPPQPRQAPATGGRGAGKTALLLVGATVVLIGAAALLPGVRDGVSFLVLTVAATLTSFGGGEAFVGVADGFFVASGLVEAGQYYGQIVPVANALPGPILIKIVAGLALEVGGWPLALIAAGVAVTSCSAVAVGLYAGYERLRDSLVIRNVAAYIMPVICGLLASTAVSMLAAGVTIGAKVGVSALPVLLSSGLGVAVAALAARHTKAPGVLVLVVLAVASLGALRLSA